MMTPPKTQQGIVLYYQSNFYTVKVGLVEYQCVLKGLLKKEGTDVVVGDRVDVDNLDEINRTARIVNVLERKNQLARPKIANIDRAVIVASVQNPPLDLQQLDRYVTHVQLARIDPLICISKVDLAEGETFLENVKALYERLGIPVYLTSIHRPQSVGRLFDAIEGETVVLAGQSGVGKSSLLNAYQPGLGLAVQSVSEKLQRGQHTTRHVALISLDKRTYVADTPGFSYLKFDTVSPHAIEAVFPDFAPYRDQCRFDDCLHMEEADCAVKAHLDEIAPSRYESYQVFEEEAREYVELVQTTSQKQEYGYKTLKRGKEKEVHILKLPEKQRQASRRRLKQQVYDWQSDDDTLEE